MTFGRIDKTFKVGGIRPTSLQHFSSFRTWFGTSFRVATLVYGELILARFPRIPDHCIWLHSFIHKAEGAA